MDVQEYLTYDATDLAAKVASGETTAAELLALAQQRADQVDPTLNAIVRRMDAVAERRVGEELTGPFAGVPFLIKDLLQEYAGLPTSCGTKAMRNAVAGEHSLVVQRFLDAGVVIFGKTNAPELGSKGITEPTFWGPCRNPWDTDHTPGGSSGGSAAAVAAGIVPVAGANDGGGSIRIPAGCCGLVGLKTSRGLTPFGPEEGDPLLGWVTQGVLSRTVRDSAGFLDAIVGPNPYEEVQVSQPATSFTEAIKTAPGRLRIGYSTKSAITAAPDPEAVTAVERAAQLLTDLGHEVEEVDPPYDDGQLSRDFLTIWFAQLYGQVIQIKERYGAKDADFEPDTLAVAELGRAAGLGPVFLALERIHGYTRSLVDYHSFHDLLLTPTLAKPPLRIGETDTPQPLQVGSRVISKVHGGKLLALSGIADDLVEQALGWVPYTQLANMTGRPAISVPLHWTSAGLPLGVQFVGPLGSDGRLLSLAAQLEEAAPWVHRYPGPC